MGYKFGGVDLESTYGFYVSADGLAISEPQVKFATDSVPGRHGAYVFAQQMPSRTIMITGLLDAADNATLQSNWLSLEAYLMTDSSYATAPTNNLASAPVEKNLEIPGITGKAFPCYYQGGAQPKFQGGRLIATSAIMTLKFFQANPFTVTV